MIICPLNVCKYGLCCVVVVICLFHASNVVHLALEVFTISLEVILLASLGSIVVIVVPSVVVGPLVSSCTIVPVVGVVGVVVVVIAAHFALCFAKTGLFSKFWQHFPPYKLWDCFRVLS